MTALAWVGLAILSAVLGAEAISWCGPGQRWMLRRAAAALPQGYRDRYLEECWQSCKRSRTGRSAHTWIWAYLRAWARRRRFGRRSTGASLMTARVGSWVLSVRRRIAGRWPISSGMWSWGVYTDNDIGASTRSRKPRPDYQRMLADARAGRFEVILAYASSRLTRRPREHEDLIELAERHGVAYRYVRSPSVDLNTAAVVERGVWSNGRRPCPGHA